MCSKRKYKFRDLGSNLMEINERTIDCDVPKPIDVEGPESFKSITGLTFERF